MYRRRLQGLSKRITNKGLSELLGVSESTIRRWKNGTIRNPKPERIEKINQVWNKFKNLKSTDNVKLKRKREEKLVGYIYEGKQGQFKHVKKHRVYRINSTKWNEVEQKIKLVEQRNYKPDNVYLVRVNFIDKLNNLGQLSTPFGFPHDLGFVKNAFLKIVNNPSAIMKRFLFAEIVLKQF